MKSIARILSVALVFSVYFLSLCSAASADWNDFGRLDEDFPSLQASCNYRLKIESYNQYFYVYPTLQYEMKDPSASNTQVLTFNANFFVLQVILSSSEFRDMVEAYQNAPEPKYMQLHINSFDDHDSAAASIKYYSSNNNSVTATAKQIDLIGNGKLMIEENCPQSAPPQVINASASSQYSSSYSIEKSYDNNPNTYWVGEAGAGYYTLEYTLDKVHALSKLEIDWYTDMYSSSNFDVLVSEDGVEFTTVAAGLNDATSVDLAKTKGRVLRIVMHSINNSSYPIVREIKFLAN